MLFRSPMRIDKAKVKEIIAKGIGSFHLFQTLGIIVWSNNGISNCCWSGTLSRNMTELVFCFVIAKHACTLFVKEIPYSATKEELKIVFDEAVDIRFLGGGDDPNKG